MAKIVFFCIPAHGHTNPTLGVVKELVRRGHEVLYYSYDLMKEKIEAAGAQFVSCDDCDGQLRLSSRDAARVGKDMVFSTKLLVDMTLAMDGMVCREMERIKPDCIVADSMAVWGKAVALKLGIPFVCSTTTFAFNQHSAKIMKRGLGELLGLLVSMPRANREVKRLQKQGYPVGNILDILQNDDQTHTVVYTSRAFQPCGETFSDRYAFVGPSIRPGTAKNEKNGQKLVYISMGTVNNDMPAFYRRCIEVFGKSDWQVILSVGDLVDISALGTLPENVSVYPSVDQIAVLEKADAFVTHCGMNSVSEALYFGVPLVMLPKTPEQSGVAERVRQLGAGILAGSTKAEIIRDAVEQVLSNASFGTQAQVISAGFRSCSGAKGAADKILQVCGK